MKRPLPRGTLASVPSLLMAVASLRGCSQKWSETDSGIFWTVTKNVVPIEHGTCPLVESNI